MMSNTNYRSILQMVKRINRRDNCTYNVYYDGEGFLIAEDGSQIDETYSDACYELVGSYTEIATFKDLIEDCEYAKELWHKQGAA